ncbi:MAG TPA: phosphoribosylformylglycinamidine synthase subunit PurS, partial [bacterium]|nr:phosphoribosylformylglycinamidine synthase subunit PurS [bacterium]
MVRARVFVTLKRSVLDPQGKAIQGALETLGYPEVESVRVGKVIEVTLKEGDQAAARARLEEMCRKLLANPVIEDYRVEIEQET